jgi:hypothetical protein
MGAAKEAVRIKVNKSQGDAKPKVALNVVESNGLHLTLDNSLKKFANDEFFINHAKAANQKLKNGKSQS